MTESPAQQAVDSFGNLLVTQVRAKSISDWEKILDGRMQGETAERLRPRLSRLGPEESSLVQSLVPEIVDTVLHHLLWALERREDVDIAVETPGGRVPSLREVSDGLAGELYGWIPRFGSGAS